MTATPAHSNPVALLATLLLHHEVNQLNSAYATTLDNKRFEEWPLFFTDNGHYKLQARENFDRGLPLALMAFESRGMMKDRVYGVTQTIYHGPYYTRHIVGAARIASHDTGVIKAETSYVVVRTRPGASGAGVSEIYNVGRYIDELVRVDGALMFKSRLAVYDSELVLNSLIYPI